MDGHITWLEQCVLSWLAPVAFISSNLVFDMIDDRLAKARRKFVDSIDD